MGGQELLDAVQAELAPRDAENRLVPLVVAGTAPRAVFRVAAAEELRIVPSDWRSLHLLASRAGEPAVRSYFGALAGGEELALAQLAPLAEAVGLDLEADYEQLPGCQAYPSYFAWLALNAEPADVVVALTANFAAWGRYCAAIAAAMRGHYGFADAACGFFDFFAVPQPSDAAAAAARAGLDAGTLDPTRARRYARMIQSYELMFWNTLADVD